MPFVYFSECFKKEIHSHALLEERLKQNTKLHSVKLLTRVLKICVLRGRDEGREWRGGEGRGGTEREGEGRRGKGEKIKREKERERGGEGARRTKNN